MNTPHKETPDVAIIKLSDDDERSFRTKTRLLTLKLRIPADTRQPVVNGLVNDLLAALRPYTDLLTTSVAEPVESPAVVGWHEGDFKAPKTWHLDAN